jgi:hypothetical protein
LLQPNTVLVFFDETFRESLSYEGATLGALCGIAIPEKQLHRVAEDVFRLKLKHFGSDFARDGEIKGKELLKNYAFRLAENGVESRNLALAVDLLNYIQAKGLHVFGCVCFEKGMQKFQCEDVRALDMTFRYVFERVDMFVKVKHPDRMAKIIFDDRDYRINKMNAEAITNFFQRSSWGLSLDSIVKTPFFAISQSQNVGLQLADLVTTVIGLCFSSHPKAPPFFEILKRCFFFYEDHGRRVSGLKVLHGTPAFRAKEKALDSLTARGRDK